ncbi:hypothetical protein RHSP_14318 [Rhizobium freirei PRF 81]|uniref:Uncharacterized protein n=1 Tax=Rhizobium freirei PRF 81 TaxID=363754 RepID=N6UZ59_9HYPH|nr:hypothetical protein RHSP_14318 [Rhizobium freirei PRF 81]
MRINCHYQSIPAFGSRTAMGAIVVSLLSVPGIRTFHPAFEYPGPLTPLCGLHTYRQENSKKAWGSTMKPLLSPA